MTFGLELVAMFLAVNLAFWAKNLRESRADRALGRSYLEGILEDLRRDLVAMNEHISYRSKLG